MSEKKQKRSPNFLPSEKELLLELVDKHFEFIENRKPDVATKINKWSLWQTISEQFNSRSDHFKRTGDSLKTQWECMKKLARKEELLGDKSPKAVEDPICQRTLNLLASRSIPPDDEKEETLDHKTEEPQSDGTVTFPITMVKIEPMVDIEIEHDIEDNLIKNDDDEIGLQNSHASPQLTNSYDDSNSSRHCEEEFRFQKFRGNRYRITPEQRSLMLKFVKANPAIVVGRFDGPVGAKHRYSLLKKMASLLNQQQTGALKTPEKWLRSWQDWKSDTKRKATLGRQPGGAPGLTELEKELMDFVLNVSGSSMDRETADTLQGSNQSDGAPLKQTAVVESQRGPQSEESGGGTDPEDDSDEEEKKYSTEEDKREKPQRAGKKRKYDDELISERMACAMEKQAEATSQIAIQIGRLADVGNMFARIWANIHNVRPEDYE